MYLLINSNKMFFIFILFFSTLISTSANSWLGCWIGLEINLLSFIPLISKSNNLLNSEASLKYFLIQSIASINFLFSIILMMIFMKNFEINFIFSILINSSLLMKMGSTPFHFWYPNIMEGLSWFNCFILMTWQKISPMIILSYYMNNKFIMLISMINVILGSIGGFNQLSLRKLLAFSSINNLGWLMMSLLISENLWMMYMMLYSFLIFILLLMFMLLMFLYLNQLFNFNMNFIIKISIMINFMSMGGLPPFIGFFPKWIIINFMLNFKLYIVCFSFIMMSLMMLFLYIRIIYSSFMFFNFKIKWFKSFINNKMIILINMFNFISLLGMILSTMFFF
uniref:NADH-ubiquinone oxidoreductase chain 2 n=1 Tax=Cupido argiades TaxID=596724 RepID=M4KB33_CUPAG|nr:NADH dehydrogenase subunit 2 [Cupido argiades]AGE31672.1 NADH dehydrogenase subunit 2 [Cupido argiades]